jgi:hypothetical protein
MQKCFSSTLSFCSRVGMEIDEGGGGEFDRAGEEQGARSTARLGDGRGRRARTVRQGGSTRSTATPAR